MKVKVVCVSSVLLGCLFFHQQGEKVGPPHTHTQKRKKRDALFGKSTLVSFNEVSKGPDDFSTSGLFFVLYIDAEMKVQMYFMICGAIEH